jgi:hypothetical protein
MRTARVAPGYEISPLRRFFVTLHLDPIKMAMFYVTMGVLFFSVMFGALYYAVSRQMDYQAIDTKDAPMRTATVVVQGKSPWVGNSKTAISGVTLEVTINNKRVSTPTIVDERTFSIRIGDRIQVNYRVGKSGAVYIEEWKPLLH